MPEIALFGTDCAQHTDAAMLTISTATVIIWDFILPHGQWKRGNFRWRLKMDMVSIERMCAGRGFRVEGERPERKSC